MLLCAPDGPHQRETNALKFGNAGVDEQLRLRPHVSCPLRPIFFAHLRVYACVGCARLWFAVAGAAVVQAVIVEGVGKQLGGDEARLAEFVMKTRDYGKGALDAATFWT